MQTIRFWVYFDTIPHAVAWLSSVGFVFGKLDMPSTAA